jgi:hypothetical protein
MREDGFSKLGSIVALAAFVAVMVTLSVRVTFAGLL